MRVQLSFQTAATAAPTRPPRRLNALALFLFSARASARRAAGPSPAAPGPAQLHPQGCHAPPLCPAVSLLITRGGDRMGALQPRLDDHLRAAPAAGRALPTPSARLGFAPRDRLACAALHPARFPGGGGLFEHNRCGVPVTPRSLPGSGPRRSCTGCTRQTPVPASEGAVIAAPLVISAQNAWFCQLPSPCWVYKGAAVPQSQGLRVICSCAPVARPNAAVTC